MILIDFVYLNSPGGIVILEYILGYIKSNNLKSKCFILFDERNFKVSFDSFQHQVINASERSRLIFYYKKRKKFNALFCVANVPPPIKSKIKTYIFFHNELILNSKNLDLGLSQRSFFLLKRLYIKWLNHSNYDWLVQTDVMKTKLNTKFKSNKIFVAPIFNNLTTSKSIKYTNTFLYPTSNNIHKNNSILISSFISASKKTNQNITLYITLKESDIINFKNFKMPTNLKIIFLGTLEYSALKNYYFSSQFIIYPSLRESFGLPLIEGAQAGCYVLASNLDYANEIINPTLVFDPKSIRSISTTILRVISEEKLSETKIKSKDNLHYIMSKLLKAEKSFIEHK